jgi:hypothetical protein
MTAKAPILCKKEIRTPGQESGHRKGHDAAAKKGCYVPVPGEVEGDDQ